jgi:hypothetical protein
MLFAARFDFDSGLDYTTRQGISADAQGGNQRQNVWAGSGK